MSEPTKPDGCIDHQCALMPHGGMGVTGACKCLDDIATYTGAERSRARRNVHNALRWWQAEAARLEAERDINAAAYHALREGYIDTEREAELRARAEKAEAEILELRTAARSMWELLECSPRATKHALAKLEEMWRPMGPGLREMTSGEEVKS